MEGEFPCVASGVLPVSLLQDMGPIAIVWHWGHCCCTLGFEPQDLKGPKLLYESSVWKIRQSQHRQIKGSPKRYPETYHLPLPLLTTGGLDRGTQPATAAPPYRAPKLRVPLCHSCPGKEDLCNRPCNSQTPEARVGEGPLPVADLTGTGRVMRGALERLLPLSLQSPRAQEDGESSACLGCIPYFALTKPRGHLGGAGGRELGLVQ